MDNIKINKSNINYYKINIFLIILYNILVAPLDSQEDVSS